MPVVEIERRLIRPAEDISLFKIAQSNPEIEHLPVEPVMFSSGVCHEEVIF